MNEENKGHSIQYLFEPQSVAIIGASHTKGKIGHAICHNLLEGGYKRIFACHLFFTYNKYNATGPDLRHLLLIFLAFFMVLF